MSDKDLSAKKAYFQEQDLLDVSDDEQYQTSRTSKVIERTLTDPKAMPPPRLIRYSSSINGPTPKEMQAQAEFEAHTKRQRAALRPEDQKLEATSTAPESNVAKSFPVTLPKPDLPPNRGKRGVRLKRTTSLPEVPVTIPFYRRMGDVPRTLTKGRKKAVPADDIKVRPEDRQLLKGKIVYFYPNDDDDNLRRIRLHKIIELGAAWVRSWRDDVTHIVTDYKTVTYDGLLAHLKNEGLSVSTVGCSASSLKVGQQHVVVVPFQPYLTESMEKGVLVDPSRRRFRVEGAPVVNEATEVVEATQFPAPSQSSLKIKPSGRQLAAQGSQKTDSHPNETTPVSKQAAIDMPTPVLEDRVEDSFVMPSPEPAMTNSGDQFNDELSLAIKEAKAIAHLPLDDDDDEDSKATDKEDADNSGTDEEPTEPVSKSRNTFNLSKASMLRDKKGSSKLNTFQCMDPSASGYTTKNLNARTIQVLEEMCKHYDQMQDHWRTFSYRKCITTLKKQSVKITTAKQAIALPAIGSRLADKIEEIVLTDRLRKLDNTRDDPADAVLCLFLGIYGAGLVQANKWIAAGHRTLSDLRLNAKLSDNQVIGIDRYDDFNSRIPRAEVEAHGAYVKAALRKINPDFEATVMGSYRRGAKDSGDIDMIITAPNASLPTIRAVVFEQLVPHLFSKKFLTASLATSRSYDPSGSKWHGASCLPGSKVWRRIDLLIVPEEEMGAALIYFTGNDIFNRSIRLLARKKGMRLNQKGLYKDVRRGRRGEKLNEGVLVEGRSERRIFEVLGVPWREPHERIC
ncbi:hypothetical protein NX059_002574 [Plenodomus lindquistii]|nr:hypothetical protein NX059_002574 [Plenodomus lindquistii]